MRFLLPFAVSDYLLIDFRHTDATPAVYGELLEVITEVSSSHPGVGTVLAGDFNGHWYDDVTAIDQFDRAFRVFVRALLGEGYSFFPDSPAVTYISGGARSTIDYLFWNGVEFSNFLVEPTHVTQHLALTGDLVFPDVSPLSGLRPRLGNYRVPNKSLPLLRISLLEDAARFITANLHWSPQNLYDIIVTWVANFGHRAPQKSNSGVGWLAFASDEEKIQLDSLYLGVTDAKADFDLAACQNCQRRYVTAMSEWRRATVEVKRAVTDRIKRKHCSQVGDKSACWSLLKELRSSSKNIPIAPAVLVEHFREVYHDSAAPLIPLPDYSQGPVDFVDNEGLVGVFTMDELDLAFSELNYDSATGPDGISARLLRAIFNDTDTRGVLLSLMNRCFLTGCLPTQWQESEITVLFKGKGSVADANNYRGINVLNGCFKLYERLIYRRVLSWADEWEHVGPNQFGFRAGRATNDAIFSLQTLIDLSTKYLGVPLFALFIDFAKAFPSVSRVELLRRLVKLGMPKRLVCAVASMFSINSSVLKIGGMVTVSFLVNKGVREGGVLSPLLFALVMSVIWEHLRLDRLVDHAMKLVFAMSSKFALAYADDLVLLGVSPASVLQLLRSLQVAIDGLGLVINVGKTKAVCFQPTSGVVGSEFDIEIGGVKVEWVAEFEYLGYTLHHLGSDALQREKVLVKALCAANVVGKLMRDLEVCDLNVLRVFFLALVSSQLYGLQNMGFEISTEMANLRRVFIRASMSLPISVPVPFYEAIFDLPSGNAMLFVLKGRFLLRVWNYPSCIFRDCLFVSRCFLMPHGIGWMSDFVTAVAKLILRPAWRVDLCTEFRAIADLENGLSRARIWSAVQVYPSLLFFAQLFPSYPVPEAFLAEFSSVSRDTGRLVYLLLAGNMRWSFFTVPMRDCPHCASSLSSQHFVSCRSVRFMLELDGITVNGLIEMARTRQYERLFDMLVSVIYVWAVCSRRARPGLAEQLEADFFSLMELRRG